MPCEKYQYALNDLAASGGECAGDVRAHLDECASCHAYLQSEQFLFAAIDSGLRQTTNVPLPASFLHRFEVRVEQIIPVRRILSVNLIYTMATGAALILLSVPILQFRNTRESVASQGAQPQQVNRSATQENIRSTAPNHAQVFPRKPRPTSKAAKAVAIGETEVLVPSEEKQVFERFLSNLNGRQDLAVALVKPMVVRHEQDDALLETREIETAALTVSPLTVPPLEESNDK
jgi:hypothetical protein